MRVSTSIFTLVVVVFCSSSFTSAAPGKGKSALHEAESQHDQATWGDSSGSHHDDQSESSHHYQSDWGLETPSEKPWLYANTHHHEPYQFVHFSKNKMGDSMVDQSFQNDPNLRGHYNVFTALENVDGAHQDSLHYQRHHQGMNHPINYYNDYNHLHETELHGSMFVQPEPGQRIESEIYPFEKLPDHLMPDHPIVIDHSSPIELRHLKQLSKKAKEKNIPIARAILNHGHNSQQYGETAQIKHLRQGAFLTGAQSAIQEHHKDADVVWTGSYQSFQETSQGAMNRPEPELSQIVHPKHLGAASKDKFHAFQLMENYNQLEEVKKLDGNIIKSQYDHPYPPIYRENKISFEDAVHDMKSTHGKSEERKAIIEMGIKYLNRHFKDVIPAMEEAVNSKIVKKELPEIQRKMSKRLGRFKGKHVKQVFQPGDRFLSVEATDPLQMGGLRMALHNANQHLNGPQLLPMTFVPGATEGYTPTRAGQGDQVHGLGLFNVHPEDAALNHIAQVRRGRKDGRAWKDDHSNQQYQRQDQGQYHEQYPGQFHEQYPGQFQEQYPGQFHEKYPGQFQEQYPGQFQEQHPGQLQGHYPGQH